MGEFCICKLYCWSENDFYVVGEFEVKLGGEIECKLWIGWCENGWIGLWNFYCIGDCVGMDDCCILWIGVGMEVVYGYCGVCSGVFWLVEVVFWLVCIDVGI